MPKVTIAIPAHNNEGTIWETLKSASEQDYPDKEILVIDDASTDKTDMIVRLFNAARYIKNKNNLGIGKNLVKLMQEAKGKYIIYLCADDVFTSNKVVSDYVKVFDKQTDIGVIGRYYYFFRDGYEGAIGVCRERNILIQSCCPSGMALRKLDDIKPSNKIFIEMPYMVSQYLDKWRWTMFEYDTVAARFKPGTNTGTKKEYYTDSPLQNWIDLTGDKNFKDFPSFIMLKNRAPKMLLPEIKLHIKNNKNILYDYKFWLYSICAMLIPSFILRQLTNFYRHRISRALHKHSIITRDQGGIN